MILGEKDMDTLSTSFLSRKVANDRINFGLERTKNLNILVHWVHAP